MEVVEVPSGCAHRAEVWVRCLGVMEDGIFVSILLVLERDGDCGCCQALSRGGDRWNGSCALPQAEITLAQGDSAGLAWLHNTFSHPQEKEEGQDDEVSKRIEPRLMGVDLCLVSDPFDSWNWQSQLGSGWRVGISKGLEEISEHLVQFLAWSQFAGVMEAPGDQDL